MPKPLIGITCVGLSEVKFETKLHENLYASPQEYVDSVERAGGLPVLLPSIMGCTDVLDRLDGIIFSGGADIDPVHYNGNTRNPNLLPVDAPRDAAELELIHAALLRKNLPILAICRGFQLLNVALGGDLIEHLPDEIPNDMHRDGAGSWTMHDISVAAGSAIDAIMASPIVNTQSGHHQALRSVAQGLNVVATSTDNIVEAVEYGAHPWCIGVQWHPERTAHSDPSQQAIFDALVKQAS